VGSLFVVAKFDVCGVANLHRVSVGVPLCGKLCHPVALALLV
jgi:hypothetical protein